MSAEARGSTGGGPSSEAASTGPAPKRMRVSRACEQCRSRKAKCDGKTPTCSPCVTLSQPCTYGAQPRKRGLPPGSVSALERTVKLLQRVLGLLIVSVEGSEHALLGLVQRCGKNLFDDGEEGRRLTNAWKEGLVPETLELLREKGNGEETSERSPAASVGAVGGNGTGALSGDLELAQEHFQEAIRAISGGEEGLRSSVLEGNVTRRAGDSHERDDDEGIGPTGMDWVEESQSLPEGRRERDNSKPREAPTTVPLPSNIDSSLQNNTGHSYQNRLRPPVLTPPIFSSIDTSDEHTFPGDLMLNQSIPDQSIHRSIIPNQSFHPIPYHQSGSPKTPARNSYIMPIHEQPPEDCPQLPSNSRLLLDLYFTYTHVWFPILDKYDLIRFFHIVNSSSSSKRKAHPPKAEVPGGKRALLYAVLALATIQNEGLSQSAYAEASSSQQFPYAPSIPSASTLYTTAQKLIFKPVEEYSLEHVQALLLLSLINITLSHLSTAWLLAGHAGRVAVDIGLKSEIKSRFNTRTWQGYLVLETFISLRLGRDPQIREKDWAVPAVEEDGWEEWDSWKEAPAAEDPQGKRGVSRDEHGSWQDNDDPAHILSVFNQLVGLSRVVRRVASMPPPKQFPKHHYKNERQDEENIHPQTILYQLHSWCRNLLPHCSFDILNPTEVNLPALIPTAPHISNLHLYYAHAILELHDRSRSFPDPSNNVNPNAPNPISPPASAAVSSTIRIMEHVKSSRSLVVVPCTFIHFSNLVSNDIPGVPNGQFGVPTAVDKSVSEQAQMFRDELEKYQHKATVGFLPGRGLLKMTSETTQEQQRQLATISPPRLLHTFTSPTPMISPPGSMHAGMLSGQDPNNQFRQPSLPVATGSESLSRTPSSNNPPNQPHRTSSFQVTNMHSGQEDDHSAVGNINNAFNPGTMPSQATSLSLSQTAPSPDGFDEEMGMLECLPWLVILFLSPFLFQCP